MFSLTRSARTKPGALRDHDAASPVPRSADGTRLRQLIRLQRDPATPPRRISVEQSRRMLRGTGWQCGTRSARTVLEAFSIRGNSEASNASNASSGSGAAKWLISRRPSVLRILPVRFATAADVAVRQSDSAKYRRTGCTPIQGNGEFQATEVGGGRWDVGFAVADGSCNSRGLANSTSLTLQAQRSSHRLVLCPSNDGETSRGKEEISDASAIA